MKFSSLVVGVMAALFQLCVQAMPIQVDNGDSPVARAYLSVDSLKDCQLAVSFSSGRGGETIIPFSRSLNSNSEEEMISIFQDAKFAISGSGNEFSITETDSTCTNSASLSAQSFKAPSVARYVRALYTYTVTCHLK